MKLKNARGITLIALIVTIIVLVIIAGISIAALTSDNGILRQTNTAKVEQIEGTAREQVKLAVTALRLAISEASSKDNSYRADNNAGLIQAKLVEILNYDKSGLNGTFGFGGNDLADNATGTELKLSYTGDDYQNACNDTNANIVYTITIGQKVIELTDEVNETLKSSTNINVGNSIDANPGKLEGSGTETDPYVINSVEDLVFFSYDVRQGNTYESKYVNLGLDIDFKSNESYVQAYRTDYGTYGYDGELKTLLTSGEGFIPIGLTHDTGNFEKPHFAGIFNGNGKIINNLRINKENKIDTDIGLFTGNLGEIKNLGVNGNVNLKCSENDNSWAGYGIICGTNMGEINNCWASGEINIEFNAVTDIYIGAIAGAGGNRLNPDANISNCYNKANINVIQNHNNKILYIGGIHGGSSNLPVNNCYNRGTIIAEQNGTAELRVGGIAGTLTNMSRCYNLGIVKGIRKADAIPIVGGISGGCRNVEYCCNIGEIYYEGKDASMVGTLVGLITGTITNSSSLKQEGFNGIGKNYGGVAVEQPKYDTVAEMPSVLSIVGSAFKSDTNNINDGYPILSWQ